MNSFDGRYRRQIAATEKSMGRGRRIRIEFVRDETFSATMPISAYLEAAAMTGRIVEEPALAVLPMTGRMSRLAAPPPSKAVVSIFDQACRENPTMATMRGRTSYDDYGMPELLTAPSNSNVINPV